MTSYPPPGGDPQWGPGNQGQPYGGTPQQPGQQPYPQQYGYPPPGQYPQQYGQQYGQYPQPGGYAAYPAPDQPGAWVDPADPLVATGFSGWFSKTFGVFARSWQPLLLIQLATYLPGVVLGFLLGLLIGLTASVVLAVVVGIVVFVIVLAAALIAQGASVYYVTMDAAGTRVAVGDAIRFGAARALALLGWGLLAYIMIVVGLVLLILPGLYLGIVFGATLLGVIMFERGAIDRCFSLVNRRFFPTVGRMLLFALAVLVYAGIMFSIGNALFGQASQGASLFVQVLNIPLWILTVGVAVVTYAELRAWEAPGQVTTQRLAAELRR